MDAEVRGRLYGGDMLVVNHRFHRSNEDSQSLLFAKFVGRAPISAFSAICIFLHFGLIRDPLRFGTFYHDGIIGSVILFVILVALQVFGTQLYLKCLSFDTSFSYPGVWGLAFGEKSSYFGQIILFLALLDFPLGVTALFSDLTERVLKANWEDCPGVFLDRWFIAYASHVLVALPTFFFTDYSSIRWYSYIGMFCFAVTMVADFIEVGRQADTFSIGPALKWGGGTTAGIVRMFEFACTVPMGLLMPDVLRSLDRPTSQRASRLLWATGIITILCMTIGGFLNYLAFHRWVDSITNLASDFMDQTSTVTVILQVSVIIDSIFTEGYYCFALTRQLTVLFISDARDIFSDFLSGIGIILFTVMTAFAPAGFNAIVTLVSIFAKLLVMYVFPPLFFLHLFKFRNIGWGVVSVAMLVAGVVVGVISLWSAGLRVRDAFQG
jgi:hypothetical protein